MQPAHLAEGRPVAPSVDENRGRYPERQNVCERVELNPYLGRGLCESRDPSVERVEEYRPADCARGVVELRGRSLHGPFVSPAAEKLKPAQGRHHREVTHAYVRSREGRREQVETLLYSLALPNLFDRLALSARGVTCHVRTSQ